MNRFFVLLLLALVFCGSVQTRETYAVVISMDDFPKAEDRKDGIRITKESKWTDVREAYGLTDLKYS